MHRRRRQRPVCGGAERSGRGRRSFVASLLELLQKARLPFWEKQLWRSPELRMQLLLQNNQWALAAPPGNDQEFLFLPLKKEGSATYEGKRLGCGCSVDACGGSIVDWRTSAYASFRSMGQRVASPECLRQMPLALQSEAASVRTVSADETDVEVVMSVSGATTALVLFFIAVGVKPSPFVTQDFVLQGQGHYCLDGRG